MRSLLLAAVTNAAPSTNDLDDDLIADLLAVCGERVGSWAGAVRHYRAAAKLGVPPVVCEPCRAAAARRAREHYRRPGEAAQSAQRVTRWRAAQRAAAHAS